MAGPAMVVHCCWLAGSKGINMECNFLIGVALKITNHKYIIQ